MRQVSACGCDELLIAPMTADELHDVVAIQLGEPRPGTEAFAVTVELAGKPIDATVSNLSVDGVRLVVARAGRRGPGRSDVTIAPEGERAGHRSRATSCGRSRATARPSSASAFDKLDDRARARAREAHAVAGRAGRRADARRAARRLHRGDAVRRAAAGDGRPRRVRHRAGHVHELARRARVVRVPAPGADPGLRVPRLLGAVHPAGVDGARRDRPRHGDVVLRAVPLHRLRSPGGAAAAVRRDPRVERSSRPCSSARAAAARSSSTTCPSATSRSSRTRRTSRCASYSCGRSRSHSWRSR